MNMLQISVTGGVLILAAVLFRAAGRKRLPMRTFTVLWHIALLRLLLPVALPASFSAASVGQRLIRSLTGTFSRADGADIADVSASPAFSGVPGGTFFYESAYTDYPVSDALSAPNAAEEIVSSARFVPDWRIVVWIAGAVLCLSVFAALYVRALRRFRQSLPLESDFARDWLATHAPRRKIEVRRSDRIDSPLTYGVLRPVILLPSDTDLSDTKRLEFVLAHELTHIRHFDSLTKILLALAVSLHWFNPAVWALYCFFNRDMELACDEAVVRMFGEDTRRDYALMLLELVEKKNLPPLPSGANGFGQVAIRERIGAIMKVRRITWAASLAAVIAVCGITAVFATTAAQEKPEESEQTEQADTLAAGQEEQERLLDAATEAEQAEKLRIEAEQYARHEAERALAEVLEAREAQQLAEEQAQLQAELAEQLRREAEQYAREAMERALEAERQGQEIPEESELSEQTDALAAEQEEQARLLEAQLQAQLQAELAEQLRREAEQYAREAVERALEAERQRQEEVQADIPLWEKYNMTEEEYMSEKNLRFREKLEEKEARRLAEEAARQLAEEQQAREEQVSEPDIPAWVKLGISEDEYLHGEKYQKIREKLEQKEAERAAEEERERMRAEVFAFRAAKEAASAKWLDKRQIFDRICEILLTGAESREDRLASLDALILEFRADFRYDEEHGSMSLMIFDTAEGEPEWEPYSAPSYEALRAYYEPFAPYGVTCEPREGTETGDPYWNGQPVTSWEDILFTADGSSVRRYYIAEHNFRDAVSVRVVYDGETVVGLEVNPNR